MLSSSPRGASGLMTEKNETKAFNHESPEASVPFDGEEEGKRQPRFRMMDEESQSQMKKMTASISKNPDWYQMDNALDRMKSPVEMRRERRQR